MTTLEDIHKELVRIRKLLEKTVTKQIDNDLTTIILLLPEHLQKTLKALAIFPEYEATASMVAEVTERARAVESGYLNQLEIMGYLTKQRQGRKAWFKINIHEESTHP